MLVSIGVPLNQIANEVGTSGRMTEQHYAGVIANWDRKPVVAETQTTARGFHEP